MLIHPKYILVLMPFLLVSCTREAPPEINISDYQSNAKTIMDITKKLTNERSPKELHKAAVAVQQSRIGACVNVANECTLYGDFLREAVRVSEDHNITDEERHRLFQMKRDLELEINKGLRVLTESQ